MQLTNQRTASNLRNQKCKNNITVPRLYHKLYVHYSKR